MKPLAGLAPHWPAIERALDEALDQPAAERLAWLERQGTLAPPVLQAVRELLARHAAVETGDFMVTLPPLQGAPPPVAADGPAPGDSVGPWVLLRELGRGGMGSVWLAERADGALKRRVALKLPHLSWARGLAERMARERDILASLEHPHIARLYDAGVDAVGRPWLALEVVQGQAIDEHARHQALDVKQRLQLLLQVCEAVAYAHSRLVIHRDLKPGNILVGDDGQVRLLDFGIAKLLDGTSERGSETALTAAAGRALTLDYASPEQVRGEPLGTASDVYSLGVVAYELLSGARPYRPRRSSAAALEDAIERDDAPAASRACTDAARARVLRGDLDAILAKALRKQPAERYASVDALAQDLRRYLAHEPVQAQPDRLAYVLAKFLRRHAAVTAAVVAATASLAVGLGVALSQAEVAREAATQAQAQRARAEAAGALASAREQQARQAEQRAQAAADDAGRERERAERAAEAERLAAQAQARAAAAERRAAAEAQAQARRAQAEAQRASQVGNTLLNTFSRVAADPAFRTPEARERLGTALQTELDRLEVEVAKSPAGVAEAHGVAASVFNYLQQPERQLRAARREQQLLVAAGESPTRVAESHRQLALALTRQFEFGAALDEVRAGLRVLTDEASAGQRLLRGRLHRAASRYARQQGLVGLAYAHSAAAVQSLRGIEPRELEPSIQHLGAALADHAQNAAMVERGDEARQLLAQVDALYAAPLKALREADRADVELARCQVDMALGQPAQAARACQRALDLYAPQFGAVGRNADTVGALWAAAQVRAGALDEAAPVLQRIREGRTGQPAWLPSAEWALARGDLAQAEAWLRREQEDPSHALPPRRLEHQRLMAALRLAQGRPAEAVAEAQQGLAYLQQALPGAWLAQRNVLELLQRAQAALTLQDPAAPAVPPTAAASRP